MMNMMTMTMLKLFKNIIVPKVAVGSLASSWSSSSRCKWWRWWGLSWWLRWWRWKTWWWWWWWSWCWLYPRLLLAPWHWSLKPEAGRSASYHHDDHHAHHDDHHAHHVELIIMMRMRWSMLSSWCSQWWWSCWGGNHHDDQDDDDHEEEVIIVAIMTTPLMTIVNFTMWRW